MQFWTLAANINIKGLVVFVKNILLLTFGSRGDVQPYIALGKALTARGAKVTLCTSKSFTDAIRAQGLTAAPLSVDIRALAETPKFKKSLTTMRGKFRVMRESKQLMFQQLDETWRVAQQVRPDLIVYHPKAAAAAYIARALNAVAVPSFLQPGFLPTRHLPPVVVPFPDLGRFANRAANAVVGKLMQFGIRSLVGPWLKKHPELTSQGTIPLFEGYCPNGGSEVPRLHAFSSELVPKPSDWPTRDQVTGAWFLDETGESTDNSLLEFLSAGESPVYFGFGSMATGDPGRTTRIVIDAVRSTGRRAVLATGWGGLDATEVPDSIHVIKSAPHRWLFPKCSAVVHHGGAGTTHHGLRCGRPTLICPVFGDQPFWGKRVAATGVGPAPIPLKRLTTRRLEVALDQLHQEKFSRAAESISQEMLAEGGVNEVANLLITIKAQRASE